MAQLQTTKKTLSAPFIKKIQAVSQCSYIRVSKKVPEKCLPKNAQKALFSSVRSQTIKKMNLWEYCFFYSINILLLEIGKTICRHL